MRNLIVIGPAALGLALSACASTPDADRADELERLAADCEARGGILVPSGAALTGRPEADNYCRITGGASRISRD